MKLFFRGTDEQTPTEVPFGHAWPDDDNTDMNSLKASDPRRPFNYFRKTFRLDQPVQSGYRIDAAALFRDSAAVRIEMRGFGGNAKGIVHEEERYGIWLCKDFIPIEPKFEWFNDEECPLTKSDFQLPLIFVNCQAFSLTANRGSVGNSPTCCFRPSRMPYSNFLVILWITTKTFPTFLNEYQQDLFSRLREKDKKRFNGGLSGTTKKNGAR